MRHDECFSVNLAALHRAIGLLACGDSSDAGDLPDRAALTMKWLTAQMLLRQTSKVGTGAAMLAHAAAGGVGTIFSQWGSHLGATIISPVGSEEKI